jgi:hypothetical protein
MTRWPANSIDLFFTSPLTPTLALTAGFIPTTTSCCGAFRQVLDATLNSEG